MNDSDKQQDINNFSTFWGGVAKLLESALGKLVNRLPLHLVHGSSNIENQGPVATDFFTESWKETSTENHSRNFLVNNIIFSQILFLI